MTLVSVTCVGAFDAVGSILVVALMIAPPATAYLLTDKLNWMIILSVLIGILSAIAGYWVAAVLDLSIAGCMATMTGVFFTLVFLFAPHRGIVAIARRQTHQKWDFASRLLSVHLLQHELTPEDTYERELRQLEEHFMWERTWAEKVVKYAIRHDLIVKKDGLLYLSDYGRRIATDAVEGRL
jgi:manganese/zinc/iron transport system permease protein